MGRECKPSGFLLKKNIYIYIYTYIYICIYNLFMTVPGLHCCVGFFPVADSGGYSLVVVFHCGGFSCWAAQALGHTGFSSCSERSQ